MQGNGKLYLVKLNYSSIWPLLQREAPAEGAHGGLTVFQLTFSSAIILRLGEFVTPTLAGEHTQISRQLSQIRLMELNKHGQWQQLQLWQSVRISPTVGVIWRKTHAQHSKLMSSLKPKIFSLKLGSWNRAEDHHMHPNFNPLLGSWP